MIMVSEGRAVAPYTGSTQISLTVQVPAKNQMAKTRWLGVTVRGTRRPDISSGRGVLR